MGQVLKILREHRHFVIVVTVLTLVTTWPTVIYVFRSDVFWLPSGRSGDALIELWDVWYGSLFLSGQADRFYTNLIFFPEGVSLTYHPFVLPYILVMNAFRLVLPLSNAYCLTFLLINFINCLSAYVYILHLFKEKWLAIFGSVIVGLSPHVVAHVHQPDIAFVAPLPLALYLAHRGIHEDKPRWLLAAGVLLGLITQTNMYLFVITLITVGLFVAAHLYTRRANWQYWKGILLLCVATGVSGAAYLVPLLQNSEALYEAAGWHSGGERHADLVSFFLHERNPYVGPIQESIFNPPDHSDIGGTSYLGFVPLVLVIIGLGRGATRRKMLPWLALWAVFALLRLGSVLEVNGTEFPNILLPKFYLNQVFGYVFEWFGALTHFTMGALLPFAILSCYGVVALRGISARAGGPVFLLALVGLVALEYHRPIVERIIPTEELAYLEWFGTENNDDIRLINLPIERSNSKRYSLYQLIGGFPQAQGAISRTPDSAFDYIRENDLLNTWFERRSVTCETANRESYLAALDRLESDGFSHVVFHDRLYYAADIRDSFRSASASYRDDYVSIYRLTELRESCP